MSSAATATHSTTATVTTSTITIITRIAVEIVGTSDLKATSDGVVVHTVVSESHRTASRGVSRRLDTSGTSTSHRTHLSTTVVCTAGCTVGV